MIYLFCERMRPPQLNKVVKSRSSFPWLSAHILGVVAYTPRFSFFPGCEQEAMAMANFEKEVCKMRRIRKPYKDHRVFRDTADRTKAINVFPVLTRGGFRL